jgi:hypothetical protein
MQKKIIFLILSLFFSQYCIYYVNSREKDNLNIQLKDPLIDNLPFFKGLDKFYDLTVLPPIFLNLMFYQKIPIDNLIINLSLILVLRGICIITTSIPKFKSCKQENYKHSLLFSGGCYDKIFSGHLAFIITFILYLINYTNQSNFKIIYYFYIVIVSILSLITESHYSIDLLISWILSVTLFFSINKNINFTDLLN